MRRTARTVAATAAVALLAGACSSSHPKTPGPTTPSSASSLPGSASTPPTTTGSTSTAPPATAAGSGRCTAASLKGSFTLVPGGGSAGHVEGQVVLTNTGPSACKMFGYIGMQLLGPSAAPLPTNVVRVPGTEQAVTLAPGSSAMVAAQFSSDVPGPGDSATGTCQPVAKSTQITPPDDTQALVVQGPNSPVCQRGTIDIQPVQASGASGQ